jgi:DNA-binding response OmpR family regulator
MICWHGLLTKKQKENIVMKTINKLQSGVNEQLKILVVDDTPANLGLMMKVLTGAGHQVRTVQSGEEAIASFQKARPDVVLMDVKMPGIGGIEATRRIRALDTGRWVPIIFISAMSDSEDMVKGLEAGGDDYLGKPIDVVLLLAKIKAMQRIAMLEERLSVSNAQLNIYHDHSEHELNMAREIMEQMVEGSSVKLKSVELWLQPSAVLGGDVLITQKFKREREYVLLADAMGHGLSAALPLVPLVQIFSDLAREGKSVSLIIQEMNARLSSLLPLGNFVAVTLISLDRKDRLLEIWNGGNPPALLSNSEGKVIKKFKSRHLAPGVMRGNDFDASTESYHWNDEICLTLYSDGLAEAINSEGIEFGEKGIIAALKRDCSHLSLKTAIKAHIGEHGASDDISLATVKLQ